ncbi:MAG: tetratricopeptide repeat protein [Pyrinomonadaceae bacterium]
MKVNRFFIAMFFLLALVSMAGAQTEESAQQLIAQKRLAEARAIYVELAAQNPDRMEYKVWVARLTSWMGEYGKALKLYDGVLKADSNRTEALTGKAYVYIWDKNIGSAKRIFEKIKADERESAGVLIAKINWLKSRSRFSEARSLNKFALEKYPENSELIELKKGLEGQKPIHMQFGCSQNFDPVTASTLVCGGSATYTLDHNKISAFANTGKRLGSTFKEIGINWNRELDSRSNSNLTFSVEPNGNFDFIASYDRKLSDAAFIGIDARIWHLNDRNIKILSPRFAYKFDAKNVVSTTFYVSDQYTNVIRYDRIVKPRLNASVVFINPITNGGNRAITSELKYGIGEMFEISGSYGIAQNGNGGLKNLYGWGFMIRR